MTNVGAAINMKPGQTWPGAIADFERITNRTMGVRRAYDKDPVPSLTQSQARHDYNFSIGASLRRTLYSIKPNGSTPLATLEAFAKDVADKGHDLSTIIYHEPVDNMSGSTFVKLYKRCAPPLRATGMRVGVCYTNWSATVKTAEDPQNALLNYWPGDDIVDFIAFDEYPIELASQPDAEPMDERARRLVQFAKVHNKPLSLAEFGVDKAWPEAGAEAWLRSVTDWAEEMDEDAEPLEDICYFHAAVGGNFWLDNQPEYVNAYRDMYDLLQGPLK